jgi:hypothetical protein
VGGGGGGGRHAGRATGQQQRFRTSTGSARARARGGGRGVGVQKRASLQAAWLTQRAVHTRAGANSNAPMHARACFSVMGPSGFFRYLPAAEGSAGQYTAWPPGFTQPVAPRGSGVEEAPRYPELVRHMQKKPPAGTGTMWLSSHCAHHAGGGGPGSGTRGAVGQSREGGCRGAAGWGEWGRGQGGSGGGGGSVCVWGGGHLDTGPRHTCIVATGADTPTSPVGNMSHVTSCGSEAVSRLGDDRKKDCSGALCAQVPILVKEWYVRPLTYLTCCGGGGRGRGRRVVTGARQDASTHTHTLMRDRRLWAGW